MSYKIIVVLFFLLCITCGKCLSQSFDSVHVYAVYMKSMYRVKIDKDLIKNEVEPIILKNEKSTNSVYSLLIDTVKGNLIKKLTSNQLDIRLSFEFFKKGKNIQTIGVIPQKGMFIDYSLYEYDREKLKYLDEYIEGLSKILGIK